MDKKIKIQIKNRCGCVIFEYEKTDNTIKQTVVEAVRQKVNLRGANLRGANLCEADLREANLCGADLCGADLRGANLRGANLCEADLCEANLCGANLREANLREANLRGANLCEADLRGCVLDYDNCKEEHEGLEELKDKVESNSNLKLTKLYENHDSCSSRWGLFWRNLIIIREWEVVDKVKTANLLSGEQKDALKAWIKTIVGSNAGQVELKAQNYESYCRHFTFFGIEKDGHEYQLDFAEYIEGIEAEKMYTLAELGIEL